MTPPPGATRCAISPVPRSSGRAGAATTAWSGNRARPHLVAEPDPPALPLTQCIPYLLRECFGPASFSKTKICDRTPGRARGLRQQELPLLWHQAAAGEADATSLRRPLGPQQKLGKLSAFCSCVPTGMRGPTCIFWARLTRLSPPAGVRGRHAKPAVRRGAADAGAGGSARPRVYTE